MPRRRNLRKIVEPPRFKSYKPTGLKDPSSGFVELLYEEYEAIKLADYELLSHHEACKLMGVARPTFARIYETARKKIAKAFAESLEIRTKYGHVYFDSKWLVCNDCGVKFTIPSPETDKICPMCGNNDLGGAGEEE